MTGSKSALLALVICAAAAALEGALAGRSIRARFGELRLPRFSPSLSVQFLIGAAYYIVCSIVLFRLLTANLTTNTHRAAFIILLMFMAANAAWGLLFFRHKNLRASFLAFFPYGFLTLVLVLVLTRIDSTSAVLLAPYLAYLGYALWQAHRVWVLNRAR